MSTVPQGLDPEVFQDLSLAAEGRDLFNDFDTQVEFWEMLCLVKGDRQFVEDETGRLHACRGKNEKASVSRVITDSLRVMRAGIGPIVKSLRAYLEKLPGIPSGDALEFLLGFIAVSPKGRESAARWVADPAGSRDEAVQKLLQVNEVAERYRSKVREIHPLQQPDPPPPPPAPAAPPEAPAMEKAVFQPPSRPVPARRPAAPVAIPGVDPDILADVRRVEQCRKIFEVTHQQIEIWEVFYLIMVDGDATKAMLDDVLRLKEENKGDDFTLGALALFEKLLDVRAKHGKFVKNLREFVKTLQIGTFGKETTEMALGFIVASARGREAAERWLGDPGRNKHEASGRMEDLISRAMKYQTALRQ